MKRIRFLTFTLVLLILLGLAGQAQAGPDPNSRSKGPPVFELPRGAVLVADGVYDLGLALDNGRVVRGYAFLHPRKGGAKPDGTPGGGKGKGNGGGSGGSSSCFAAMAKGAVWKSTEPYVLDSTNSHGLSEADVSGGLEAAIAAWDDEVSFDIFGSRDLASTVDAADIGVSTDGKNEVLFGDIAEPGTIAITIVWGFFSGPPHARELVEWEMIFDDPDYSWGDAEADASLMDFLNIATHEVGHAAGLDHPDLTCTEETMYAYADVGETKKRTLEAGDIAGINDLY